MGIATVNPTTLETLQSFSALTPETIQLKLAQSEAAFQSYLSDELYGSESVVIERRLICWKTLTKVRNMLP